MCLEAWWTSTGPAPDQTASSAERDALAYVCGTSQVILKMLPGTTRSCCLAGLYGWTNNTRESIKIANLQRQL